MNVCNKVHTVNLKVKQLADQDSKLNGVLSSLKDEQHRDTQPPEETNQVIIKMNKLTACRVHQ
jgi:hypothetical protein